MLFRKTAVISKKIIGIGQVRLLPYLNKNCPKIIIVKRDKVINNIVSCWELDSDVSGITLIISPVKRKIILLK